MLIKFGNYKLSYKLTENVNMRKSAYQVLYQGIILNIFYKEKKIKIKLDKKLQFMKPLKVLYYHFVVKLLGLNDLNFIVY